MYDPTPGRFLSEDPNPAGTFADGPNNYAYVHNGPTNATDPTGMATHWLRKSYTDPVISKAVVGGYIRISDPGISTNPGTISPSPSSQFLVRRTTTYWATYCEFSTTGTRTARKLKTVKIVFGEYNTVNLKGGQFAMVVGVELSKTIGGVVKVGGLGLYGLYDPKDEKPIVARSRFGDPRLPPVVLRNLTDPPVAP